MAVAYRIFASYLRFKEVLSDPLGHLDRAGEFDASGVRRVAWLRVFDNPLIPAADVVSAFDRERKIADAVQSTYLASGVDCVVHDGTPAIAIDYVASQPLSLVLDRVTREQFPIPVDNALLIAEKIALALCATSTAEIDGARVVHGFLHPSLVFVTNDGEGLVSAFGIAEHLLTLIDDTESANVIHPYIAPEVLDSRVPSRRGDVYSLGAILFQLLTGTILPTSPDERAQAVGDAKLAYDEESVPDDIKVLLQRTLARHPEERFSSAADLKKELDRLLYGGAYSPTTFNLALFIDRLFRSEIEAEETAVAREMVIDVNTYLAPRVEPEPIIESSAAGGPPAMFGRPQWIGLAGAGAVAIAAVLWLTIGRGPSAPPPTPTPTTEEIAVQRLAQDEKMRELAENLVSEMMAAKEEEIREELVDRQAKIDDLQRRLIESERRTQQGQLSIEDMQRREEIQRQIAAEEEEQRLREADLEAERVQAAEDARQQAMVQQTATAAADTITPLPPPAAPTAVPTTVPTPPPTAVVRTAPVLEENSFVNLAEVDSLPVLIKESPVTWPRAALHSQRQGVVILQATVDANGVVEDLKVLRADHEGFGIPQAVMDAVMKYRFKPATKAGVRVKTHATVTKPYRFVRR